MLSSGSGRQTMVARALVQAARSLGSALSWRAASMFVLLVAGCSSLPASINPVSWWHNLQGGKIAEERPPPPGADQPYPNLASVPPKPAPPDRASLTNIANALIADRTNAHHVAAAAPIADPSLPNPSPDLFGRGTVSPPPPAPPPGTGNATATMAAAEAPPPSSKPGPDAQPVPAPATAPVGPVQTAVLAPPGAAAQPPAVEAAAPPPLPTAPPPPPNLGSSQPPAAAPPSVAAATPPPPAAAASAMAPAANSANSVGVTFITGSAVLPSLGADSLKQLAARRGSGLIAVTGYGDAASDSPDAQSAALSLGLARAKAMAAALTAAGVPATAVQVDAEATGRGGTARLVQ